MSLEQTYTTVPGQVFACMSVVGPECPQKNDQFGLKIYGAFPTREEAANHAKLMASKGQSTNVVDINAFRDQQNKKAA
jgi:hypothetical protein